MNQSLPLVEQLKNLERLQELDLRIDSIKKNQSSLPMSLKQIDDSLSKLKAEMELKKSKVTDIEKVKRQAHAASDINKERLERANAKLDVLHKPQEFQAANKEIDQLKKLGMSLEEQNKKTQDEVGLVNEELKTLNERFEKLKQERDLMAESVSGQDHQFQSDLNTLLSERTEFVSGVEKRLLAQYDRVRTARGGLGIVPAIGGRCKGCNMVVPPQLYNEVQRGNVLHSCPSCHRILFVPITPSVSTGAENTGSPSQAAG